MIYEITKWSGGLSDFDDRGIPGAFKFGANLDIRKKIDSLSAGQALMDIGIIEAGSSPSPSVSPSSSVSPSRSPSESPSPSPTASQSISASQSPSASVSPSASNSPSSSLSPSLSPSSALTSVFRDLVRFWVKASDGFVYGFGNVGFIYRIDEDYNVAVVYRDPEGSIRGAGEWYSDSGKTYLYWATQRNVNRKEIPGANNWNDVNVGGAGSWPKTNLNAVQWHTMRQAGGSLLIANGSWLALVGYDDSYTNEALNLIPGNIAQTIVERNGRNITGTARAGNLARGVNAAIDSEVPLAQIGDDGELFYADMNDFIPFKRFPGGGKVNPDGVTNEVDEVNFFEWEQNALSWIDKQSVGNLSLWAVYNAEVGRGGIYSCGRKKKDAPFTLNLDYQLDADELGALTTINGVPMVSYRDGSEFGVKVVDPNNKATGIYEGLDFRAPVKKPVNITPWNYAEAFFDPLPSGTSIEFWYKLNKSGSFIRAKTAEGIDSYSKPGGGKAVFRINAQAEIFEPRFITNPNGNNTPNIHRARAYFN